MKIVLSGGWSYGNIGDEAIAKSTIYLIKKYFPSNELTICSYDSNEFKTHHNMETVSSIHKRIDDYLGFNVNMIEDAIVNPEKYDMKQFVDLLDSHTLFIMGGGGYFNDRWETQFLSRILEIELAKAYGAQVAIIGQSIGPIKKEMNRKIFIKAMSQCDYINVRDLDSQKYLKALLPKKTILKSIDTALIISDVYKKNNQKGKTLNVMAAGYSKYTSIQGDLINSSFLNKLLGRITLKYYIYDLKIIKILRSIEKKEHVKIRFIMSTKWSWDLAFTNRIVRWLPKDSYEIITHPDLDTFCEYLSKGHMLISSKMHPVIISTSYNIDSIAISYNFKIDNFMESIDRKQNCYRNDKLNVKEIIYKVCEAYQKPYTEVSSCVEQRKKEVYQMADDLQKMFAEI